MLTSQASPARLSRNTNAFDALRILAAFAVLFSHSYPLYGLPEPRPVAGQTIGSLAVAIFFSLSGYLVCQSWTNDPSLRRFAMRRALRVMPGLVFVVTITALVIGPLFSSWDATDYFQSSEVYSYIVKAALMWGGNSLPGLFETSPLPSAVNGSLWTLSYEILMYMCLAITGKVAGRRWMRVACPLLLAGFGIMWIILDATGVQDIPMPLTWRLGLTLHIDRFAYLGAFFFAGATTSLYRDQITLSPFIASASLVVLFLIPNATAVMVLLWMAAPYFVCTFAYHSPSMMARLNGFDYSYGIYIYAFPIQQAFGTIGMQRGWSWHLVLSLSAITTLIAAASSWYLIEKPALTFKRRISKKNSNY